MSNRSLSTQKDKRKGRRKAAPQDISPEDIPKDKHKLQALAKTCILDALSNGGTLRDTKDIRRILRGRAEAFGLAQDHFAYLDGEDLCDLYMEIMRPPPSPVNGAHPTINTNIKFGQPTPSTSECDGQSEGRAEQMQQNHDDPSQDDDLPIVPAEGDEAQQFDMAFYHTVHSGFEPVTAARCKNKRSYMSVNIAKRYNLRPDRTSDQSIRLTWKELDPARQKPKSQSTRFWLIDDESIEHDIAIGAEYDKMDEPEEQCEHSDDSEGHLARDDSSEAENEDDELAAAHSDEDDVEDDSSEEESDEEEADDDEEEEEEVEEVDQRLEGSHMQLSTTKRRPSSLMSGSPPDTQPLKKAIRNEGYDHVAKILVHMVKNFDRVEEEPEPELLPVSKAKKRTKTKKAETGPSEVKRSLKQSDAPKWKKSGPELNISRAKKKYITTETESPRKQTKPSRPTKAVGTVTQSATRKSKGVG
ncbi:hypothetical protein K469DRAFT_14551 [Zopfia rhizophila CBS 207.26]|uniref:Uncharacterized protein n=1 Tax=Zopfia rhizophila CBS 207.26 TaxID=1314779 RepID=A0A6A6EVF9_9PEZI|nr:hypothetical protein K469DRAFT_14551 [Zopfia rhizophila CBS 207.26]